MTEEEIQDIVGKDRVIAGHQIVASNVNQLLRGQQDVLSVTKSGLVVEYEIKVSRADFKRDKLKGKDQTFNPANILIADKHYLERTPNQFYYVVPDGLVGVNELPDYAGLFYVTERGMLVLEKAAPMIHRHKLDLLRIYKKCVTNYQQRHFLGCCLLTYNNRSITERNKKRLANGTN